jgi:Mrp family chromosome partitioning ATPase
MALFVPVSVFIFVGLYLLPTGARVGWASMRAAGPVGRDTAPLAREERHAKTQLVAAESLLTDARMSFARAQADSAQLQVTTASPRGDSLMASIRALDVLIERASNAPLSQTYRAIGEAVPLRDDARTRALLDSLADIERERDEFGSGAAVDPVFVSLTTRANALGRAIVAAADERRHLLRRDLAATQRNHPFPTGTEVALPDTLAAAARRDSARTQLRAITRVLANATDTIVTVRSAAMQARAATQLAPAPILVVGSAVLALVVLFALTLGNEIRAPRIADGAEAEHVADARVLSVGSRVIPLQRMRRAADRQRPPLLDPQLDTYRMLAWHVSAHGPRSGVLVITGDAPTISAVIAANIAAVLANEARAVLLLDIDFDQFPIADIVRVPVAPGIAAVLENRRRWSETIVQVTTGRGKFLDCIPAGVRSRNLGPAERNALGGEVHRAARRYDLTIVNAPLDLARQALAGCDVLVCATLARTQLSRLARAAAGLRDNGARVLGVALWEGDALRLRSGRDNRRPSVDWAKRATDTT